MQSVLITGANGFVGRHLLEKMSKQKNIHVRCLIRRPSLELEGICSEIWIGDLRDKNSIKDITKGIDTVFHLATTGNINSVSGKIYKKYYLNNVQGTKNLLNECARHSVKKFIHFSSVAVYGNPEENIITEKTPRRPVTPYEKTKCESELLVRKFCALHGITSIILRPSTVYGEKDRSDIRKLDKLIKLGIAPVIGDGKNIVHLVHVDDVVEAAIYAWKYGKKSGVYIINSESIPINEIIDTLGKGRKFVKINMPVNIVYPILKSLEFFFDKAGITIPFNSNRIGSFSKTRKYSTEMAVKNLRFRPKNLFKNHAY